MLPRLRSIYGKFILLALVVICFLLYIKVLQVEHSVDTLVAATINEETQPQAQLQQPDAQLWHHKFPDSLNELQNEILHEQHSDDSTYEKSIRLDLDKQNPKLGYNGEMALLSGEAKIRGEEIYKKISLNQELSDRLPYNRTIRDARHPDCKRLTYNVSKMPSATVIIIFYNEPYSVLIRTVYSTLTTCNSQLLKEIILVDDGSSNEELRGKLDYYIATRLPTDKVKVLRLKNR